MPPLKAKYKQEVKETRTPSQIAIHSAMTSSLSILIPGYSAQYIRVKNPITGLDPNFSVKDIEFFELFYELSQLGLKDKLMKEIEFFTATIDPGWQAVYSDLNSYFTQKEIDNDSKKEINGDSTISN